MAIDLKIAYICARCGGLAGVPFSSVGLLDSGTTLACDKCGETTVVDLSTPALRAKRYEVETMAKQQRARVWKGAAKRWWRQARASWAAETLWIRERQALQYRVEELETKMNQYEKELAEAHETIAKLEEITTTDTCCAYCGAAYPEGTPRFGGNALTEHIKVCPEHPMRRAMERIKQLEADLWLP